MPAIVACPKCKARYQLPDGVLGKAIKCKSCGTAFQTKATAAVVAPNIANEKAVSPASASAGRQGVANELARFGIDGPLHRQPDVFAGATPLPRQAPDFLGNHASEPGFGEVGKTKSAKASVVEDKSKAHQAEFLTNPALRLEDNRKRASEGGKKTKVAPYYQQVWFIVSTVFPLLLALILLVTYFSPTFGGYLLSGYFGILCLTGGLIGLWNLINCLLSADETLEIVLLILVPFYIVYFCVKHWSQVWQSTIANLAVSFIVVPVTVLMVVLYVLIADILPNIPGFHSSDESAGDEIGVTQPIDYLNTPSLNS